jgi:hypothetical protein
MLLFEEDEALGQPAPCWSFGFSDPGASPDGDGDDGDDEQSDAGGDSDPSPAD